MTLKVFIVDTNVIVSSLVSANSNSPPARILDAMLDGNLLYLMSSDLLNEYSSVLRRPLLVQRHGLMDDEIDRLLSDLVANAMWRKPAAGGAAPDTGDNHLWALLADHPQGQLVTGDRLLVENPPNGAAVISPRHVVDELMPRK